MFRKYPCGCTAREEGNDIACALHKELEQARLEAECAAERYAVARERIVEAEVKRLDEQIGRLAQFIMDEVPGEPSRSEGAVDCAIRWMRARLAEPESEKEG